MVSSAYLQGDDPRVAGKADAHLNMCMERFKTVSDDLFYSQVSTVLSSWYQRFLSPPSSASRRARGSKADDEAVQIFE